MAGATPLDVLLGADGPEVRVLALDERHAGVLLGTGRRPAPGRSRTTQPCAASPRSSRGRRRARRLCGVCEETAPLFRVEATSVLRFISEHRAVVVGVWRKGGSHGLPVNAELDFDARNSTLGQVAVTRRAARIDGYAGTRATCPRLMEAIEIRAAVSTPVVATRGLGRARGGDRPATSPSPPARRSVLEPFAELVAQALENAQARRRLAESPTSPGGAWSAACTPARASTSWRSS
jgi:hypothetical protein